MRLIEIKLAGFKTFVNPTVIHVPSNLVGIVGPNGCGKSNIIDAVRWVLGESRASALRGESLQDVIFNGSATRKPVGRASVELIFDNSAGRAAGQWKIYNEIAIHRVVQRDGESSYYINNIRVRRRDVTDLFLGTGVSGRGYAIIEQGMISRIIEARPQELRTFLEEAAGISRYHEKRHETGLRLADSRNNLQRVDDVLQELNKQRQHLEVQAKQTARYQFLGKQLAATRHVFWTQCKQRATESRNQAQQEIELLTQKIEVIRADLDESAEKLVELRMHHQVVNDRQHQIQGGLYAAAGEIARIEQNIQHILVNKEQLDHQLTQAQLQLQDHEQQLDEENKNLEIWLNKLAQAKNDHLAGQNEYEQEVEKLPQMEAAVRVDQNRLTELKEQLVLIKQNEKLQQNQQAYIEKTLLRLAEHRERLIMNQSNQLEIDPAQLDKLRLESAEFAASLEKDQDLLDKCEAQEHIARQKCDTLQQTIQLLERDLAQADASLDVLQRLQSQIEDNHELSTWMVEKQLNLLPRLWQQLSVESGWETALEAVLRERLQSVIIDRLEQVLDWEVDQKKRPVAKWSVCEYVELNCSTKSSAAVVQDQRSSRPLSELINYHHSAVQVVLESWLRGVAVVDNLETGLMIRKQLAANEMLVTKEGHSITSCGVHYFAPDSAVHGVLQRQREIIQIKEKCKRINQSIVSQRQIQIEVEQDYQHTVTEIAQIRQRIEETKIELHNRQLQIVHLAQQIEHVTQQRAQIERELIDLTIQIEGEFSRKHQIETELAAYQENSVELEELVEQAQFISQRSGQMLMSHKSLMQRLLDKLREVSFNEQNCQNRADDYKQRIVMITRNKDVLAENIQNLRCVRANLDELPLIDEVAHWQAQHEQHERDLATSRCELEDVDQILRILEQTRMQAEQQLHECSETLGQARLREQEAAITETQLKDKLFALEEIAWEMTQQFINEKPAKLQLHIDQLNEEIAALGPVNLGVLEELDDLKLRQTRFEEQLQDLRAAIDTLEQAIRQIDRETRERLQETFDQVNCYLSELFASIFGGGTAKLMLDNEDILEAGVLLNAHPPGKRNSSIQLLSGGEKALTALALVFSLFKLNPAPFCLLDEVDAPLDDSNVGRFCKLVKCMASETQFLFISHNKIAMQMAQQLIGVTMREQGVSRVVAVDLDKMMTGQS